MIRSARVGRRGGVPQLLLDGRPVRPRLFWGGANASPVALGADERPVEFTLTAPLSTATGTLHFRFGQAPGRVVLEELSVEEIDTGRRLVGPQSLGAGFATEWNVWPPPERNRVGRAQPGERGVAVTLTAPSEGDWPDFHLFHAHTLALEKGRRYRVRLRASADPPRGLTIALYQPGTSYTFLGGPAETFARQVRHAAAAGVDLVSAEMPLPWPAPGAPVDWGPVDAVCERVFEANARALFLPRIGCYAPAWWLAAHPDAVMRWDDGDHGGQQASVASAAFLRDASARLAALIRYVEARYGGRVLGYHPTGQNTGEWFWMDAWERSLPGYGAADRDAWRAWRRARGLPEAEVPSPAARRSIANGAIRAPAAEADVIAFSRFLSDLMAEGVLALARTVRRASAGRKLSVFFYGYGFEFAPLPTGPATSGHYALRRVLDSPDIDILCGPCSYYDRGLGQTGPVMSAAESVLAAGKLWLNEDDTRTFLAAERHLPGGDSGADDVGRTRALLRRNLAVAASRNLATWWMDLPGTGWYDEAALWDEMRAFAPIDRYFLEHPSPYQPEVAAVLDEASAFSLAPVGAVAAVLSTVRGALGRMGAPYGQYLADDLLAGRVPAKLVVLVNAWQVPAARRPAWRRALRGKRALWLYAPGYSDGRRLSVEGMRELTGFALRRVEGQPARAMPTAAGRALGLRETLGIDAAPAPLFAVDDARPEEALATYPDGSVALARRGATVFVGPPALTAELLRALAPWAGVRLLAGPEEAVVAHGPLRATHGLAGARRGETRLDWKGPSR